MLCLARTLVFLLALILLLSSHGSASAQQTGAALIQKTCSGTQFVQLCLSTLRSDPRSSRVDVKGLARIVLQVALAKANQTLVQAGDLFKRTADPAPSRSYGTCIEEYRGAVSRHLPGAISALDSKSYAAAKQGATDATNDALACDEQFASKSPLTDGNKNVHDLCVVASGIIATFA